MGDIFKKITDRNTDYGIFKLKHKGKIYPILVNWKDAIYLNKLEKKWSINDYGTVFCHHKVKDKIYDLYLHELIMNQVAKENKITEKSRSVLHINRLNIDNRRENLMYDVQNKVTNKNIRKKERIIRFPKESGVSPKEMPTFVWYLNPDKTHGDRFVVNIGELNWKTSSSPKLSLRYKLEEAKKFLRELKLHQPGLFEEYSMNGELNKDGKILLMSFFDIVSNAGFSKLKTAYNNQLTDKYLMPKTMTLSKEEKILLNSKTFF